MRSCNGILALKLKYIRDVHIISTKYESVEMTEQNRSQLSPTFKPKCIVDYGRGMIGINRQDQILACFCYEEILERVPKNPFLHI